MWEWLGGNAGQVQIVIGLIALSFAVLAYFKILKQIKISQDQTSFSIKQSGMEAKLNILNLTNENIKNNTYAHVKLPPLIKEFSLIKKQLEVKGELDKVETIENILSNLINQKNMLKNSNNDLIAFSEGIANIHYTELDELNGRLNTLYSTLIRSTDFSGDYNDLVHRIEEIRFQENLK